MPTHWSAKLKKLVTLGQNVLGIETLRVGQDVALEHILKKRNVIAVMPTGSGKSLLYQLPSLILPGVTVVVSPLIALIKDQIDKMNEVGVPVARIDSTLTVRQKRDMLALIKAPGGKLLLTTPERMAAPEFRQLLREASDGIGVSLFVVDEAHCVSQWGHDFRPSYLALRKALEELDYPPVLATTATAPPHVRDDILHQLGLEPEQVKVVTTSFDRPNLHYEVIALPGDDQKDRTLVTLLKKLPRPGIVYCATVRRVEQLYESLHRHGIPVAKYHGRLTKKIRTEMQHAFMARKSNLVMIATNAFGLGIDKRDIRNVIHYHVPGSLEQYAQEAGRGGRDDKPARCVLLFSPDDVAIQEYFLKGTYPTRRQVRALFRTLAAWKNHDDTDPTVSNLALSAHVGQSRTKTILSLFKDEGFVVERDGNQFELSDPPPDPKRVNDKAKQYEARRIADRRRLDALLEYVGTPDCRTQIVLAYLGEEDPAQCGRCDNCLRSKEAAIAAARVAARLESGVISRLHEGESDEDIATINKGRRMIRARVIRIDRPDGPTTLGAATAAARAEREKMSSHRRRPKIRRAASPVVVEKAASELSGEDELAALIAQQADDDSGAAVATKSASSAKSASAATASASDELEDGEFEEYDDDDDDDDDEYEYEDEVEEIEVTAAALAEEGWQDPDAEITILARKRIPKPPRGKKNQQVEVPRKRRRRRRRKKRRSALPPKSAFTSPVLTKGNGQSPHRSEQTSFPAGNGGPLVEYVRGPMRINSTPVASATPNDVAPTNRKGKKRRRKRPASGNGAPNRASASRQRRGGSNRQRPESAGPSNSQDVQQPGATPGKKRRRRRRRRKRSGTNPSSPTTIPEGPITFFSMEGETPSGTNPKRKRRRSRRRRRKPSGDTPPPTKSD